MVRIPFRIFKKKRVFYLHLRHVLASCHILGGPVEWPPKKNAEEDYQIWVDHGQQQTMKF